MIDNDANAPPVTGEGVPLALDHLGRAINWRAFEGRHHLTLLHDDGAAEIANANGITGEEDVVGLFN